MAALGCMEDIVDPETMDDDESRAAGQRGQCQTSDTLIAYPICFPSWLRAIVKMRW